MAALCRARGPSAAASRTKAEGCRPSFSCSVYPIVKNSYRAGQLHQQPLPVRHSRARRTSSEPWSSSNLILMSSFRSWSAQKQRLAGSSSSSSPNGALAAGTQNGSSTPGHEEGRAAGPAVGIDLGTTNSVVAVVQDGIPVVLPDEDGRRSLPSVVGFPSEGTGSHHTHTMACPSPSLRLSFINKQLDSTRCVLGFMTSVHRVLYMDTLKTESCLPLASWGSTDGNCNGHCGARFLYPRLQEGAQEFLIVLVCVHAQARPWWDGLQPAREVPLLPRRFILSSA